MRAPRDINYLLVVKLTFLDIGVTIDAQRTESSFARHAFDTSENFLTHFHCVFKTVATVIASDLATTNSFVEKRRRSITKII